MQESSGPANPVLFPELSEAEAREIVSAKILQFSKSRRELARALAAHFNIPMPPEFEAFFDAVDAGDLPRMQALFRELKKRRDENAEFGPIWRTVVETEGIVDEARNWPAQKLLDYGNRILGALRPGMIYVGGTDPGCFIPTFMNATSDGEKRIVFTQNALADATYLQYLEYLYGGNLKIPTMEDSGYALREYLLDYQKRLAHDRNFPNEPKQVRARENVVGVEPDVTKAFDPQKVKVSGFDTVMGVNEQLLRIFMEKNPDASIAMEASSPFASTYLDAVPLGPVLELRAREDEPFTAERAAKTLEYWRETSARIELEPAESDLAFPRMAYAKAAAEHANFLAARGYTAEAEMALRYATEICAFSPEPVFKLSKLLVDANRLDEARTILENALVNMPSEQRLAEALGENPGWEARFRNGLAELRRLQSRQQ